MGNKELYHFFEAIGPGWSSVSTDCESGESHLSIVVEYAIVLDRRLENKVSRYGFVTFASVDTAQSALAASKAMLTLDAPWSGWSLTVGPAVERKRGHHYYHHYHQQQQFQHHQQEGRTRVWRRTSDPAQGEARPVQQVVKAAAPAPAPGSKLRVDAETWRGRPWGQPGEYEAQLYHQHLQALNLHYQQQQQLQYQAELHYNMMTQQAYFPVPQYPDPTATTEQLMILPPTFYHPSGGVVWPQYPQLYPAYQQCDQQAQQQQVHPQEYSQSYLQQSDQMQDSGYHEVTNASIIAGDLSQTVAYETKEMSASPVLNLSQVLHLQQGSQDSQAGGELRRVGPFKRFKTFSGENLPKIRGPERDSSRGERGGRTTKSVKDSIITKEPNTTTTTTKGKEVKKGIKKKVVHGLPEAKILPEPFKQLSIK